ncbi:DNA polymerase III subunit delta [Virgibacillus oceani]
MSYSEVMKQIKKKQISPVYLVYGSESYFIQQFRTEITEAVLGEEKDNVAVYDLKESPVQEVIRDAETFPFFEDRKLILATNPVFLKAKPDTLDFEHDLSILEAYLDHPADYSIIAFIAPYEKIDERKKISKLLKKKSTIVPCQSVKAYETGSWLDELSSKYNVNIDQDARELMETELSTNLHLLENEIGKLAAFAGDNGSITKEAAEGLLSRTPESSSLRLVDAVIDRDLHKAISIYKDLEKMREEPIALIALLAFQFRMLLQVKLLKQKGISQFDMQKRLRAHPFVIKIALKRERQFTLSNLKSIMDKLASTDAQMKQGTMEKGLAFEFLLYDLIQQEKAPR